MLNMSIILSRYKQFASKIYNAISMYYFLCKIITDLHNSIRFITGLNHIRMHKSSVRQKFLVWSFPSWNGPEMVGTNGIGKDRNGADRKGSKRNVTDWDRTERVGTNRIGKDRNGPNRNGTEWRYRLLTSPSFITFKAPYFSSFSSTMSWITLTYDA